MTPMKIRRATVEDVDTLIRLRDELFAPNYSSREPIEEMNTFSRVWFLEKIPSDAFVSFLAEVDGVAVGCIGLSFYTLSPKPGNLCEPMGYISSMYVREQYRSQGIGRRLLESVLKYCEDNGINNIALHAGSEDGKPLYETCGFRPSSEMIRTDKG